MTAPSRTRPTTAAATAIPAMAPVLSASLLPVGDGLDEADKVEDADVVEEEVDVEEGATEEADVGEEGTAENCAGVIALNVPVGGEPVSFMLLVMLKRNIPR